VGAPYVTCSSCTRGRTSDCAPVAEPGAGGAVRAALFRLADVLEAEGVVYMIVGALAVAVWGRPRATADIDVTLHADAEQLDVLAGRAGRAGFAVDREWLDWQPLLRDRQRRLTAPGAIVDLMSSTGRARGGRAGPPPPRGVRGPRAAVRRSGRPGADEAEGGPSPRLRGRRERAGGAERDAGHRVPPGLGRRPKTLRARLALEQPERLAKMLHCARQPAEVATHGAKVDSSDYLKAELARGPGTLKRPLAVLECGQVSPSKTSTVASVPHTHPSRRGSPS